MKAPRLSDYPQILRMIEKWDRLIDEAEKKPLRELCNRFTMRLSGSDAHMTNDKYKIRDNQQQVERVNPECAIDIQLKPFNVSLAIKQASPKQIPGNHEENR